MWFTVCIPNECVCVQLMIVDFGLGATTKHLRLLTLQLMQLGAEMISLINS